MSTATRPFVRSVIAASTGAGSRFHVAASTSAKTGVAPSYRKQLADAAKESGDVITSSPGPMPSVRTSSGRPAVAPETAERHAAPTPPPTGRSSARAPDDSTGAPRRPAPPPSRQDSAELGGSAPSRLASRL